jgi:type IV pilus assembly protein PilN
MSEINLLPWREVAREYRSKQLIAGSVALWVFAALVVLGAYQFMEMRMDHQNARNAFLRAEINALEEEIKEIDALRERRDRLISRMEVIQGLQQNRTELVRIIDDLVQILPEGVYLSRFNKRDNALVLEGRAQSNARVSTFMRNLERSPWFHDPTREVINVVNDDSGRVSAFTLQIRHAGQLVKEQQQASL